MKTTKFNFLSKNILLGTLVALLLLSFTSCAKKITFQTSTVVPAARGQVTVNKDNNKNYVVKIKIDDLAEVSRLEPSRNAYVVWMETDESQVKNIGRIKSDTKFMSSKLKADFETVTAFKPVKIFITAEDNADAQYPGSQLVLETNRF
ncbi:hypothetical protein [Flavobacterium limnophilum]|uniref:hypothetical protein n=1 Tax=Flavobacterium limnophilum TaxID=3003262 RepID=UPI0022AC03B0|nr:hypothetical protein [Flavobacterium limnophilum]